MITGVPRGSSGPFSAPNGALEVLYGGTGAVSRRDAARNLNVPSLDTGNVFTGQNEFEGTTQIRGPLEITLPADVLNLVDSGAAINVLDFSASNGATYTFPLGGGAVAMVGGPLSVPYRGVSGTYSVQMSDGVVNCTSGTFTVTLPTAVGCAGQWFAVKNSGAGVITVAGSGGQTIDGAASVALAATNVARVVSDGANWIVV